MARRLTTALLLATLRALTWLAGVVPRYPHAEILCRLGGIVWYSVAPAARAAVRDNLGHVLHREPTALEVVRVFQHGAFNYWDTFAIPGYSAAQLEALVDFAGLQHLDAALAGGKGAIVASAHLGSVAFVGQMVSTRGYPVTGVLEPIEPPEVYDFFARQRQAHGIRLWPASTAGLRALLAALKRNEVVGLITDREFGGASVTVDFFGAPARFAEGVAVLALRTGAPVLIGVCARGTRGRFSAWIEPLEADLTTTGNQRENVRRLTQALARRLEYYVASHPAQWTVFQKRWPEGSEGKE